MVVDMSGETVVGEDGIGGEGFGGVLKHVDDDTLTTEQRYIGIELLHRLALDYLCPIGRAALLLESVVGRRLLVECETNGAHHQYMVGCLHHYCV